MRIRTFSATALILAALGCAEGRKPAPPLEQHLPPTDVWAVGNTRLYVDAENHADVHFTTQRREVTIYWNHFGGDPGDPPSSVDAERHDLDFWPTAVSGSGLKLYLAGRDAFGRTVIKKWEFSAPLSPPTKGTALPRVRSQTLYQADEKGRRDVAWLTEMFGFPDQLLALFQDSHEFWRLTQSTGQWALVASPEEDAPVVVPELIEDWPLRHARRHVQQGAMYTLGHPYRDYTITLFDSDVDGSIDLHKVMTTDQWYDNGYMDGDDYLDWFAE